MPEDQRSQWIADLVTNLEGLVNKEDRGALALLRGARGGETPLAAYRYLASVPDWARDRAAELAALFASWYQGKDKLVQGTGSLGAALRHLDSILKQERGTRKEDRDEREPSLERRFLAMLNAHPDDLSDHLRHATDLLRSKDVPVDWRQLLKDMLAWSAEGRCAQKRWATDFWGRAPKQVETTAAPAEAAAAEVTAEGQGRNP